jgi:hypothetical protein
MGDQWRRGQPVGNTNFQNLNNSQSRTNTVTTGEPPLERGNNDSNPNFTKISRNWVDQFLTVLTKKNLFNGNIQSTASSGIVNITNLKIFFNNAAVPNSLAKRVNLGTRPILDSHFHFWGNFFDSDVQRDFASSIGFGLHSSLNLSSNPDFIYEIRFDSKKNNNPRLSENFKQINIYKKSNRSIPLKTINNIGDLNNDYINNQIHTAILNDLRSENNGDTRNREAALELFNDINKEDFLSLTSGFLRVFTETRLSLTTWVHGIQDTNARKYDNTIFGGKRKTRKPLKSRKTRKSLKSRKTRKSCKTRFFRLTKKRKTIKKY